MSHAGNRIRDRRKEKNLTQRSLGALIGVSATSITYWERGEVEPKNKHLAALARALDLAPDYILYGATFGGEVSITPIHARVPLIRWEEISKFKGKSMELDEKTADWLYCPAQCGKRTFATTVQGDSMTSPYPNNKSYPAGIVIFVDPDATLSTGKRVLAKRDNSTEATFKEYIKDDGVSYLKPLNPQYPTILMESDAEIIGVVIGSYSAE
jgi:SOS-response transcriptional repressor LexA